MGNLLTRWIRISYIGKCPNALKNCPHSYLSLPPEKESHVFSFTDNPPPQYSLEFSQVGYVRVASSRRARHTSDAECSRPSPFYLCRELPCMWCNAYTVVIELGRSQTFCFSRDELIHPAYSEKSLRFTSMLLTSQYYQTLKNLSTS